jgi:hypothetical protein
MNRSIIPVLSVVALTAGLLNAQENPPPRPPESAPAENRRHPEGHRPPRASDLFAILDANRDGALDPDEIGRAGEALRKIDRNNDRRISREEISSPRDSREHRRERPEARRDNRRPEPPQARNRDRSPDQKSARPEDHRGGPRLAPHQEGSHRPPMTSPQRGPGPGFSPDQPRHEARPDGDRREHRPPPPGDAMRKPERSGRPDHQGRHFQPPADRRGPAQPAGPEGSRHSDRRDPGLI